MIWVLGLAVDEVLGPLSGVTQAGGFFIFSLLSVFCIPHFIIDQ